MKVLLILSLFFIVSVANIRKLNKEIFYDLEPIIAKSVDSKLSFISCELCLVSCNCFIYFFFDMRFSLMVLKYQKKFQSAISTVRYVQGLGLGYLDVKDLIIEVCENSLNSTGYRGDIMCPGVAESYVKGVRIFS